MFWIDWLISAILAFIMLNVGLSLSMRSFAITFARPRAYVVGLLLQLVYLPVMAFGVMYFAPIPDAFKVGIVILAACPGGMTSNFISYLVNANAALSISLTVTNGFIALFSVPFIVGLALDYFLGAGAEVSLPFWDTVRQIFFITIVPVFIGLLVRRRWPAFAVRTEQSLKYVTVVMLGVLFLIKFFAGEEQGGTGITLREVGRIFPYSLLINVLGLASGYVVGGLLRMKTATQVTLGVEVGIQNTSLVFLIASTLIGNEDMVKPALVYAMFTFFTALLYGLILLPGQTMRIRRRFTSWIASLRQ